MAEQHLPQTGPPPSPAPPQFDRVAKLYRWAEYVSLGPLLQRARTKWLNDVLDAQQALVLGDGDGRFLANLLQRAPGLHATAVDSSEAMLRLLARRCRFAAQRLRTAHGSATQLVPSLDVGATDLVVTHFFLDCFSQPEVDALIHHLARRLPVGATWLISDFAIPRRQPWRTLGRLYVSALYRAFGLLTGLRIRSLPDVSSSMQHAGFARIHRAEWLRGLLYSEVWQLRADRESAHGATRPIARPSTLG